MSECASFTRPFQMAVAAVVVSAVATAVPSFGVQKAHVELEYVPKTDQKPCAINVVPKTQTIWKDKTKHSGKPHKVKWWVVKDQWGDYHWKIEWKGSGTNYLGSVPDIECGKKKTESKNVGDPSGNDLYWDYKVTVYTCSNSGTELCKFDPRIGIQN